MPLWDSHILSLSLSLSLSLCQTQFYNLYSSTHIFNLSFLSLSLSPTETLKQTFTIFLAYTFNLSTSLGNLKIVFLHHIFNLSLFSLSLSLSPTETIKQTFTIYLAHPFNIFLSLSLTHTPNQCDQIKLPNVYKSYPKMISLEKWQILASSSKLPKNVRDLGKLIVAKGYKALPKVQ